MNIGDNIKVIRERKRMTAKALASELDLDISTLNRIENGIIKQFKPEFIIKICQIFGCTLDELFHQIRKEKLTSTKEQLYKELIATKDRRIKDLERRLSNIAPN